MNGRNSIDSILARGIADYVRKIPGCSKDAIRSHMSKSVCGFSQACIDAAVDALTESQVLQKTEPDRYELGPQADVILTPITPFDSSSRTSEIKLGATARSLRTKEEVSGVMRSAEQYGKRIGTVLPGGVRTVAEIDEPNGVRPICAI